MMSPNSSAEDFRSIFETSMVRIVRPGSAASRLMLLSGLASYVTPVTTIPCLFKHLSDENNNFALGKGGFAEVSLVNCPVDCPCNTNAMYLSEYCSALSMESIVGKDKALDSHFYDYNRALLNIAKHRLTKRYAVKRVRRELTALEDIPALPNVFTEVTCLQILRDAKTLGVCQLYGFGVTDLEYWIAMEVAGKNLSEWRTELTADIFIKAVQDVLRRGRFNKSMPVVWPVSICVHNSDINSSQLLPFVTETLDEISSSDPSLVEIPVPTPVELDTILTMLFLELYWDICLIVSSVHKCDIAHYDLKCANFLFKYDALAEEEGRLAQEAIQKQLIRAEEEEQARIAKQSIEANILAEKLKAAWDFSNQLDQKKAEVQAHCEQETERRMKAMEQLQILQSKQKNGKNPKVKAAYGADISALESRIKIEKAARKEQEDQLAMMQKEYEEVKADADTCEMRHTEANQLRAAARSASRAALGLDVDPLTAKESARVHEAQQHQLRLLVNLLRSMSFMRAAHLRGEASGLLLLCDFGESEHGVNAKKPVTLSALELRCRGTLPIQAPEFLSLSNPNASQVGSASVGASAKKFISGGRVTTASFPQHDSVVHASKRIPVRFPLPGIAADVWSLGCLLPELVTGAFLFADQPWTELYVNLCTVTAANAAGVIVYNVDGDVDTSNAPEPVLEKLSPMLKMLHGGQSSMFLDRYGADIPIYASSNLNDVFMRIEAVVRSALCRMPSHRPTAFNLCKLLSGAVKEAAYSKGDIRGYPIGAKTAQPVMNASTIAPYVHEKLCTTAGVLWSSDFASLSFCHEKLEKFSSLVDPAPPSNVTGTVHLAAWLGRKLLQEHVGRCTHIVCFTNRPAYDPTIRAAASMGQDKTVSNKTSSVDIATDDAHLDHIHTSFPQHALHEHSVEELDVQNSCLMQQWKDLHEDWLHKFDVWEQVDQEQLENPYDLVVNQGGKLVGIMVGGQLAGSIAVKPKVDTGVSGPYDTYEILKFAVHPSHARQGLGTLLLRWAIDYVYETLRQNGLGHGKVYLESNKKLISALTLYRKHLFHVTHERDLDLVVKRRAAKALAKAEAELKARQDAELALQVQQKSSRASKSARPAATLEQPTVVPTVAIIEPESPRFPSPYETCDLIMERIIDVRLYRTYQISQPSEKNAVLGSGDPLFTSPRISQSYLENPSGGSLRFVHVPMANEPGAIEDVALAITSLLKDWQSKRIRGQSRRDVKDLSSKSNTAASDMIAEHFTILVDPMSEKNIEENNITHSYDVLCVAGATALLQSLCSLRGPADLTLTKGNMDSIIQSSNAAMSVMDSVRPHSTSLAVLLDTLTSLIGTTT